MCTDGSVIGELCEEDLADSTVLLIDSRNLVSVGTGYSIRKLFVLDGEIMLSPRTYEGSTLLHVAARYGLGRAIEALVRMEGTPVHKVNNLGQTPMYFAVKGRWDEAVETLHYLGAPLDPPLKGHVFEYNEDDVLKIRDRVYFQRSLIQRCFTELQQRQKHTPNNRKRF